MLSSEMPSFFFLGEYILTLDFKGILKVDRVVQHHSIIPPTLPPVSSSPLLFSITWNLGKVLILRPAD